MIGQASTSTRGSRRRASRRGFTIIEAIATIVILGAIGSVASTVILTASDSYIDASTAAQLHVEASIAMDRLVRELQSIPLDPTASSTSADLESVGTAAITWEPDGLVFKLGSDLMLVIDGGAMAVLLGDVTAFTVAAYNESGTALTLPLNDAAACVPVRRFSLDLTVTRYGVSEHLRTQVHLRSTMAGGGT